MFNQFGPFSEEELLRMRNLGYDEKSDHGRFLATIDKIEKELSVYKVSAKDYNLIVAADKLIITASIITAIIIGVIISMLPVAFGIIVAAILIIAIKNKL